jgi:molybdopterin-guanine dinucleotide biosynthesis protein A
MGPLAGLAAALHLARDEGYAAVLSCGVDCPLLPENLPALLAPAPACLAEQPVIGLWPADAVTAIEEILHSTRRHSMRALAEAVGARMVTLPVAVPNVNSVADLQALRG